ncbi:Auxin Efflux Carrier [Desulfosarcina cetonica]|uniref:AEC family transporter n=1 Tax=Desulfosarcina cetonica TaxID=90730 RepID=UPI0006D296CD|nr:AEC family transporter [Desulfosarcina cetonica]VTR65360.1 Auxin Efflux Carrier [Desulfosarcina cetonica]
MIILNTIFPVFALIGLGALLRHLNFTTEPFLKASDRIVYFIFFPLLLFWKIGAAPIVDNGTLDLIVAAMATIATIYIVSTVCIKIFRVSRFSAGSFSQSCYRFNTYVGVAVIMNAFGEPAVSRFGILIGFIIPFINVLAVSTLIWFSGRAIAMRERVRITLRALISNPLIIGCLSGMAYARFIGEFPVFIDNTLRLAAMVTLPLALISIGGTLRLKNLKTHLGQSLLGCTIKLVLLPLIGYSFLNALNASPLSKQVGMLFFALPTSPAIIVLSSQLGSDTQFAATAIVLSTLLSFFSMSAVLMLF